MTFRILIALSLLLVAGVACAGSATEAYRAMGIKPADILAGTVLNARVLPGEHKQVIAVTTYFTGKRDKSEAVSVRLEVFRRNGEALISVYSRDFGAENPGGVGDGDLQLIDLDSDGVNEIIASYASYRDPLIEQRLAEVIMTEGATLRTAWSGLVEYDATRAARNVPLERRDRYRREIDFGNTMRTRGVTLFMNKQVIGVAGERLPEPKVVQETYPLRRREDLQ